MAVLKIKASSLMEVLIASLLLGLLFSTCFSLLHRYYFIGIDHEKIKTRNQAIALVYFYHFENYEALVERGVRGDSIQITKVSPKIRVDFKYVHQKNQYEFILE